jgi:hypothetical protein
MQPNIYYFNFAETEFRNWDDQYAKGMLSVGTSAGTTKCFEALVPGDTLAVYKKGIGYHGIAKLKKKLGSLDSNFDEQFVSVEWVKEFSSPKNDKGLFKSMLPIARLNTQPKTLLALNGN